METEKEINIFFEGGGKLVIDLGAVASMSVESITGFNLKDYKRAGNAVKKGGARVKGWFKKGGKSGGADFIVDSKGSAIPTSQSKMKEGFDKAGFSKTPATKTSETGSIYV